MRQRVRPETRQNARDLRAEATIFEKLLWRELRQLKRQGYHFRRPLPFRGYILDFVEHGARLAIELDGAHHLNPQQAKHDSRRDSLLEREGYLVMRFENGEIEWIGSVLEAITRQLVKRKAQPPTRNASRSNLPTRGRYIWEH